MASFDPDIILGIDWFFQLFNPLNTANRALEIANKEDNTFNKATTDIIAKFWITPFIISFVIESIAFWYFNVAFQSNATFAVLYILAWGIQYAFGATVLYYILRIMRAGLSLSVVIACYTVNVIYGPITSALSLPSLFFILKMIKDEKIKHLSLYESFKDYFGHSSDRILVIQPTIYDEISAYIYSFSILLAMVITAECISNVATLSRLRSYIAVCVASFIALLPQSIFAVAQTAIVASLMGQ